MDVEDEKMNGYAKAGLLFGLITIAFLAMLGCVGSAASPDAATVAETVQETGGGIGASAAPAVPENDPYAEMMDDDSVKGDINAPVTIVEFSDFECPFCGRYYSETYKRIDEEYIKTGKVRYVFRDYPLSFHADAQKAAEAAECAGDQGRFWEMHDMIFENQHAMGMMDLKQYAGSLGLDTSAFDTCLYSGKYAEEVLADQRDGAAYGVSGTPTFFINGKAVVGAQPYAVFKEAIDAELG